ncbi:MAG: acetyltransferase [Pseudomonadota bacterium]|nr:acetyltransferase [Pseudomonadota bacterium]
MESIVVWGAGGHAKVVAQTLRRLPQWQLLGFIDAVDPNRKGELFEGATVLGGREVLPALQQSGVQALAIAFGDNAARLAHWAEMAALGFAFPTLVDPHAVVAEGASLGVGTYVAAGAIVQPGAELGAQVIVNTGAIVEHDCRVGDGVHLCPRACLAGHAVVGRGSWIGAGALVRDRIEVGEHAFVGIGALVLADVPAGMLWHGHPARSIRKVAV